MIHIFLGVLRLLLAQLAFITKGHLIEILEIAAIICNLTKSDMGHIHLDGKFRIMQSSNGKA